MQLIGLKGKMYAKERFKEKVLMKKTINAHSERDNKHEVEKGPEGAMPAYLLDREQVTHPPMCWVREVGGAQGESWKLPSLMLSVWGGEEASCAMPCH